MPSDPDQRARYNRMARMCHEMAEQIPAPAAATAMHRLGDIYFAKGQRLRAQMETQQ